MVIKNFEEMKERLLAAPEKKKVAVVSAADEHTLEAVVHAAHDGLIEPVLIGPEDGIRKILAELGETAEYTIIPVDEPVACVEKACEMVHAGQIDCIMKGKLETGDLMRVLVNKEKGIRKNKVMSILGFMDSPYYHKVFAITDVGLLTYPNEEQKVGEIINAVNAFHALGYENPKVAILAAVEKVNPKMPETVDADNIKKMNLPGCIVEGPISFDLAMDPESARIKGYESPVAGDPDILVAPDIVSGNIAAKALTCLGGARTGGTVLGAEVPVLLVSRAATADDKYMSIVVSCLVSGDRRKQTEK